MAQQLRELAALLKDPDLFSWHPHGRNSFVTPVLGNLTPSVFFRQNLST